MVKTIETGERPRLGSISLGYTREQVDAIKQLRQGKDNYERLGIRHGASRYVPEPETFQNSQKSIILGTYHQI